ncbi:hypothetical protein Ahy_B06g080808 [Arachis hypogaea]|uniref:Kinesin motor domain-containing protein n=1 Tax=Arachis hypogaea TaxID=3818 RepID=A0A444YJ65_ARAHY|nr:hypothetical protein Ahy_B06g080808 [Arachis hypogaea]
MSNDRKDIMTYDIYVQMVEIYNEQFRDLLTEDKTYNKLEIRSYNDDGLSLPYATLRPVTSTADVMTLMKLSEVNLAVSSATLLSNRSSRSHRTRLCLDEKERNSRTRASSGSGKDLETVVVGRLQEPNINAGVVASTQSNPNSSKPPI